MGFWHIFCCICGNTTSFNADYIFEDEEYDKYTKEIKKLGKLSWMKKCSLLLKDNTIIHNLIHDSDNVEFRSKDDKEYESLWEFEKSNSGIFIHTNCWKFVKQWYDVELTFSSLPVRKPYDRYSYIPIDYGDIKKYWHQDFRFQQMFNDCNEYMLMDPLGENRQNIARLKKIISQLKLKKWRPGPSVSASFYKAGEIKLGNDKKFWIIKNNKWVKLMGKIIISKIKIHRNNKNKLKSIPQIGEYNNKPLFAIYINNELEFIEIMELK